MVCGTRWVAGKSRITGCGHLKISLRQLVGVLRILDHSARVDDRSIVVGDLRHQAAVYSADQPLLDGLHQPGRLAKYIACVIDVEKTPVERPGVALRALRARNLNRLVVCPVCLVIAGIVIEIGRGEEGQRAAVDDAVAVGSRLRALRGCSRLADRSRSGRRSLRRGGINEIRVKGLRREQPEEHFNILGGGGCARGAFQADAGDRKIVVLVRSRIWIDQKIAIRA